MPLKHSLLLLVFFTSQVMAQKIEKNSVQKDIKILFKAIEKNQIKKVEKLLQQYPQQRSAGEMQPLLERNNVLLNAAWKSWKPLHWAVECGNLKAMQLLVEHGANVNEKIEWRGAPLHVAIETIKKHRPSIISNLLFKGASLQEKDSFGKNPLELLESRRVIGLENDEKEYKMIHRLLSSKNSN